jgi:hypothetical protein
VTTRRQLWSQAKSPFDFPAALRASQRPAVLRLRAAPTIRRDHLDAVLRHQQVVESIAVIAAVADQAPRGNAARKLVQYAGRKVIHVKGVHSTTI